jgi:hypothetical protein
VRSALLRLLAGRHLSSEHAGWAEGSCLVCLAPTEVRCEFLKSSFFVVAVFLLPNRAIIRMKREAGGQGEFSVGRIFGAATPPGALVHVKKVHVQKVTVTFFFAPHALACRRKVQRDLKI